MILSCNNIGKAFGSETILENVSFHIEDHEKAAVVGINGAGKSTLLKIIVGELPADTGEVVLAKGENHRLPGPASGAGKYTDDLRRSAGN